jgi:hypothetical protein
VSGAGILGRVALSGCALLAALLPGSAAAAPPPPVPPAVHVAGTTLVDGRGEVVTLRGVNVSATESYCDQGGSASRRGWSIDGGQPLTNPSTYLAMRAWDVDVVRVPLNEDCWLGINGVDPRYGGAAYRDAVAAEVRSIHAAGMDAILDLHWSAPGSYAAVSQQPMPDADHSLAFWASVATAYRDDPAVIFDLYNEPYLYDGSYTADPHQDDWACWLHGCTLVRFVSARGLDAAGRPTGFSTEYRWQAVGMQSIVDTIRSTGATQPLLLNGLDWANDLSGWLAHRPSDPIGQLIAGWHSYPGQGCSAPACWDAVIAPLALRTPVVVGETGDHDCAPVAYIDRFLPWADAHGLGYLGWTWNVWQDCENVLIRDWSGTPRANYGQAFHDHLIAASAMPAVVPSPVAAARPPAARAPAGMPVSHPHAAAARRLGALALGPAALLVIALVDRIRRRVMRHRSR